ncbi:hypothetical protein BDY19DRAFT_994334 [Irpex rosettiformis]|uniref:Uncharacterized protein n=1 Tax=Irpex rosettiformis TaxID=378272 RepID=A0ACB8U2D4_9APHY|nr:hypothetical protein BDY19DRAFT_994334 [Irpex rosettiformis]
MPRTKAALRESTPEELPQDKPGVLKRSQSAASIGSLPTPPRTRKRKRSRSRHSRATDSGSEFDFQDSDDEELERGRVVHGKNAVAVEHNKRKLLRLDAIAAELSGKDAEDAFWMGESTMTEIEAFRLKRKTKLESVEKAIEPTVEDSPARHTRSQTRSPSSSPAQMLKRTRTGLLSPPKSHRRKSPRKPKLGALPVIAEEAPSTPPPKTVLDGVKKRIFPKRDSPNNPFLVSDDSPAGSQESRSSVSGVGTSTTRVPQTPRKHVERPTLTYVFRGVRQEFENPLYDPRYPETGVAPSGGPGSPSNLPPDHPDFSPKDYCPPRILFPEARARRKRHGKVADDDNEFGLPETPTKGKGKATVKAMEKRDRVLPGPKRQRSEWDTSDEEDEGDAERELELPKTPIRKTLARTRAAHPAPPAPAPVAVAKPPSLRRTASRKVQRIETKEVIEEVVLEVPRTRSRTRAGSVSAEPVLPPKDRSDPARRAFGPRGRV